MQELTQKLQNFLIKFFTELISKIRISLLLKNLDNFHISY